jgi:hypothetical protein
MHYEPDDQGVIPFGWGGGDNPILHGGLALAMFSMESLKGVTTQASLLYAHQIYSFLLDSEMPGRRRGMLLRRNSMGKEAALVSTDEMLGLCIGLLFYVRALDAVGDAVRAQDVRAFVGRIAECMNAHGFWVLPFAEDVNSAKSSGLLRYDDELTMSAQTGFIFAYPFSLFFRKVLGDQCPKLSCHWNKDEFDHYFPEHLLDGNNLSNAKWMTVAQLVESAEPTLWDYAVNTGVGAVAGLLVGGPLGAGIGAVLGFGGTAEADVNFEWDDHEFFVNTLKLAEDYFEPGGHPARRAFRYVLDMLADVDVKLEDDPFNLHLLGLATILAIESDAPVEVRAQAAETFSALVESLVVEVQAPSGESCSVRLGENNALFALIAARCGRDAPTEQMALDILCRTSGWPMFQVDLPLAMFPLLDLLAQQPGDEQVRFRPGFGEDEDKARRCAINEVRGTISRLLGDRAEAWWSNFRLHRVPSDFNPERRWGEGNTWEHKSYPENCKRYERPAHILMGQRWRDGGKISFIPEGVNCEIVARALVDERHAGMTVAIEGDGLDLLLPRMLAGYWGVLVLPALKPETRETLWPTLPYLGVSPTMKRPIGFSASVSDRHGCVAGAWPQKRLVALRPQGSEECVPVEGFKNGLFCGGGYRWGRQYTIERRMFRGSRHHLYRELLPALRVQAASGPNWQFYVEIADSRSALERTPDWEAEAHPVYDTAAHVIRSRVREGVTAWMAADFDLDEIDPARLPDTLDSSVFVWQIRARLSIEGSIGNEAFYAKFVGKQAYWLRMNRLPHDGSRCEVVLNPHQGTIHRVAAVHGSHLDGAYKAFNVLWLPISHEELALQSDLASAVANLLVEGEFRTAQPTRFIHLGRRDAYEPVPGQRLIQYNQTHAAQADRHDRLNQRHVHWCSHCFK